ncbi:MAG: hypothetical protein IT268_08685 [Saprospiraceae bacterium]|nr:hypothetical protein [Saprospiraceae bacterium]
MLSGIRSFLSAPVNLLLASILVLLFTIACRHSSQPDRHIRQHRTDQTAKQAIPSENKSSEVKKPPSRSQKIPPEAYEVAAYALAHQGEAMPGYKGNTPFRNREKILPIKNAQSKKLSYKEYDIYPLQRGKRRGARRVVIDSDDNAYYTKDHYKTFQSMQK